MKWEQIYAAHAQGVALLERIDERPALVLPTNTNIPAVFVKNWTDELNKIEQSLADKKPGAKDKTDVLLTKLAPFSEMVNEMSQKLLRSKERFNEACEGYQDDMCAETFWQYQQARLTFQHDARKLSLYIQHCLLYIEKLHAKNTSAEKKKDEQVKIERAGKVTPHIEEYLTPALQQLDILTRDFKLLDIQFTLAGLKPEKTMQQKALAQQLNGLAIDYESKYVAQNSSGFFGGLRLPLKSIFRSTKRRNQEIEFLTAVNSRAGDNDSLRLAAIQLTIDAISKERYGQGSSFKHLLEGIVAEHKSTQPLARVDLIGFLDKQNIEAPQSEAQILTLNS
jgi:hypothetical protein